VSAGTFDATSTGGALNETGSIAAAATTLNANTDVTVADITATGLLGVTAGGAIGQNASTKIVAKGTTLAAGSAKDITLTNSGNDFDHTGGALAISSGNNAAVTDANDLTLGAVTLAGSLTAAAKTGQLTVSQAASAATATLKAGTAIALNAGL